MQMFNWNNFTEPSQERESMQVTEIFRVYMCVCVKQQKTDSQALQQRMQVHTCRPRASLCRSLFACSCGRHHRVKENEDTETSF